ncbi:MAG: hypothetical protein DRP83_02350 [Planctomycetota bacterium]|nr:MAG: hypothetical protein DRP83_02350 [Planctomycetota bacterium]
MRCVTKPKGSKCQDSSAVYFKIQRQIEELLKYELLADVSVLADPKRGLPVYFNQDYRHRFLSRCIDTIRWLTGDVNVYVPIVVGDGTTEGSNDGYIQQYSRLQDDYVITKRLDEWLIPYWYNPHAGSRARFTDIFQLLPVALIHDIEGSVFIDGKKENKHRRPLKTVG